MQQITTVTTTVPTGDDDGPLRQRQSAMRDEDLAALGRVRYTLHNTQVITGTERVTFVDTLTRDNE
ncbi:MULTISPECIES: hypothetical protein [unclassified Frondihabitans]|uniref:hypothetical protein n=1 Tax=unclassified Frondihabitans TaxID=2626248 RepID=UPI000F5015A2|nr:MULTISPECIES: hypothetical protein [unclassified Frondihabitans]RPE73731.1 hypothetical protein EDF37_3428 [Frondihabitans sp. PhB153]RPF02132.1 hypothetical protein EDF39_3453 [Frondihabitans sp. PhB161]